MSFFNSETPTEILGENINDAAARKNELYHKYMMFKRFFNTRPMITATNCMEDPDIKTIVDLIYRGDMLESKEYVNISMDRSLDESVKQFVYSDFKMQYID